MSAFVIYLDLPKYKSEWLRYHLGNPVVFPASSPVNAIIRTYLKKLPKGMIPETDNGTLTAVAIPDSKAKPAEYYNYMGPYGKEAVKEVIDDLFRRSLWNDISPLDNDHSSVGLNKLISAWCELHGIDIDRAETVRQCYYRMRKAYSKTGINLRKSSRKKNP